MEEDKRSKFAIDLTPLKKYPDFRNLWASGLITYLGSMITYVAVPFQIKEMTNSYIAVGISGVVEIVPLILFGLYGGVLADYVDRKKMIWATEAAALVISGILLLNAMSSEPKVWVIYLMAGLFDSRIAILLNCLIVNSIRSSHDCFDISISSTI